MRTQYFFIVFIGIVLFGKALASPLTGWVGDDRAHFWQVEVVADDASRAKGLMYRPYLLPHAGMLFVFDEPRAVSFWMKNTWLTLDMRFYDVHGRLLMHYPYASPCLTASCPVYPALGEVKYVLETQAHYTLTPKASDLAFIIISPSNHLP